MTEKIEIVETYRKESDGIVYRFWKGIWEDKWHKEETPLKEIPFTDIREGVIKDESK